MRSAGVTSARAIATEACRTARNGAAFIKRVAQETGLHFDIIPPLEECRGWPPERHARHSLEPAAMPVTLAPTSRRVDRAWPICASAIAKRGIDVEVQPCLLRDALDEGRAVARRPARLVAIARAEGDAALGILTAQILIASIARKNFAVPTIRRSASSLRRAAPCAKTSRARESLALGLAISIGNCWCQVEGCINVALRGLRALTRGLDRTDWGGRAPCGPRGGLPRVNSLWPVRSSKDAARRPWCRTHR